MHKIYKQKLAEEDLIDIWGHTFKNWGEVKADSYLDELENAFNLIYYLHRIRFADILDE